MEGIADIAAVLAEADFCFVPVVVVLVAAVAVPSNPFRSGSKKFNPFSPAAAFALDASARFGVDGTAAEAAAFEEASDPTAPADSLLGPEAPAVEVVASAVGTALPAPAVA